MILSILSILVNGCLSPSRAFRFSVLPFRSSVRSTNSGNRGVSLLCFAQDNLPLNDPNGVLVANHPNNAPSVPYGAANRPPGDPRAIDVPVIKW